MSYNVFARYYDALTANVDYEMMADYLCALLEREGHKAGLTLDLACGTGSLTLQLAKKGIDIYGIDASMDMLSVAQEKAAEAGCSILFLCQKMQSLDLYGTVNTVFCSLDSINHLVTEQDVKRAFQRVSLFLETDGYFVFDLNTLYKHRCVLGENAYVYDLTDVFCAWQNHFEEATGRVLVSLDFFEKKGKLYERSSEEFFERAYPLEQVTSWLEEAGLALCAIYRSGSFEPPAPNTERVTIVAKKKNEETLKT